MGRHFTKSLAAWFIAIAVSGLVLSCFEVIAAGTVWAICSVFDIPLYVIVALQSAAALLCLFLATLTFKKVLKVELLMRSDTSLAVD